MRVNSKVQKISETMIQARRVPSRFNAFKKQFETQTEESDDGRKEDKEFKRIQDFRKAIIKQCKAGIQQKMIILKAIFIVY